MDRSPLYRAKLEDYALFFGRYGDKEYFDSALRDGFTHVAFGRGPWVDRLRVEGVFAITGGEGVRAIEVFQRKIRDDMIVSTGKQKNKYSIQSFARHSKRLKINLDVRIDLGELIKAVTTPIEIASAKTPEKQVRTIVLSNPEAYELYRGKPSSLGIVAPGDSLGVLSNT